MSELQPLTDRLGAEGGEQRAEDRGVLERAQRGDVDVEPAAEQQIRTPIPVYVEYGGETPLVRVIVRYKGFGMTEWKTTELKKMGEKGSKGRTESMEEENDPFDVLGSDDEGDNDATGKEESEAESEASRDSEYEL